MHLLALFISVFLELLQDGTAVVTETWDIDSTEGTEIYLTRNNLGDIDIYDFGVSDFGQPFVLEDSWDIDRSLSEKAGRCGMVTSRNGRELCWGIGSYGNHHFVVTYRMSNAVKSLEDFDALHMQLVSPGISPTPDDVSVTVKAPVRLGEDNSRIWGFGYRGSVNYTSEGYVRFSSEGNSFDGCSVISLIRFDKGIFNSSSIQDRDFASLLEMAQAGDDFGDDTFEAVVALLTSAFIVLVLILCAVMMRRKVVRNTLGCRIKDVGWYRDIPFDGDILQSDMVLEILGKKNTRSSVAGAMILRMIHNGIILVSKDNKGKVELSFNDNASRASLNEAENELYDMMKRASGEDSVLQQKEFSRWSRSHVSEVSDWAGSLSLTGRRNARGASNMEGRRFTAKGQQNARNLIGLRNFLSDYTLLKERGTAEAVLWKEYMVFAALFGIAEKVAKELQEINPQAFEQQMSYDYNTTFQTLYMTRLMADSITNARTAAQAASAAKSGHGGISSFGGGGGFSGGGFGGGVR